MNINEIMQEKDINTRVSLLKKRPSTMPLANTEEAKRQLDVLTHDVFDKAKRPDHTAVTESGQNDNEGNPIKETSLVPVARIGFPFQQTIAKRAASLLFGNKVTYEYEAETDNEKKLVSMVKRVNKTNRTDYLNHQIAFRLFSETEVAEYWYPVMDEYFWGAQSKSKIRLRCKVFSPFLGDVLYPHFDAYGDMDAFSREYTITDEQGKKETYLDVWTKEIMMRYKKNDKGWSVVPFIVTNENGEQIEAESQKNWFGKIPIVFYYQGKTEWADVQMLIDRYETSVSNFSDTNDYFGRPMLSVIGNIKSLPKKSEAGKVLQLEPGAAASYITWDRAPEAMKLEFSINEDAIFSNSQTPNISFESVKGIQNPSGVALKLMFFDAILKAVEKMEVFNPALQRRVNIIKSFIAAIEPTLKEAANTVDIVPVITPLMPSSEQDLVNFLSTATGGKAVMSQETAIKMMNKVDDTTSELNKIIEEENRTNAIEQTPPSF